MTSTTSDWIIEMKKAGLEGSLHTDKLEDYKRQIGSSLWIIR